MFSNKTNLNADSNYIFIKNLINGILKKRPDWYFLYIFPNNSDFIYLPDEIIKNPQVIRIPLFMPTAKKLQVVNFDSQWWYNFNFNYAIDNFINNSPELTHGLLVIQQTYTKDAIYKIINQHHYIIHSDLPYPSKDLGDRGLTLTQLIGTYLGDINIFNSDNCKKMINDNYQKYWGKVPEYKYKKIYFGFDFEYYDKNRIKPTDKPTFVYNHRFQDYKNWQETFQVFDILWQKGYKFNVLISSISAKHTEIAKKPYIKETRRLFKHEDYLKYISPAQINMINSQHETLCISAIESMIYGQVLIAPKKATFPELTPPDYPYLFNTQSEQIQKTEYLLTHPEEIKKWGDILKKFVREKFNEGYFIDQWINILEDKDYDIQQLLEGLKKRKELENYLSDIKGEIPLIILFKRLRDWIGQRQAFPNIRLKRLLNYYGFKDRFINSIQYFVK